MPARTPRAESSATTSSRFAGSGDDIVFGGAGNDHVSGGGGHDRLFGNDGDDTIFGDGGNDRLEGGNGRDLLSGGDGDDVVRGGASNDTIDGDAGDDDLHGNGGDDVLLDGEGRDQVRGGDGDDRVVAAVDGDDDFYDGGEGCDTLDYANATEGLVIDLLDGTVSGVEIGNDAIAGFEHVFGGQGDDHFRIGDAAVMIVGGGGANTFEFAAPGGSPQDHPVLHEILDFKVGDRIRMSKYDLFNEVLDELEDRFEDTYGDEVDDDDIPIRYRHEQADQMNRTVIEADMDNDAVWETTIVLQGRHVLLMVENA